MKIEKVKIKNFRSYKDEVIIDLKDMNIFLWKNDIWKSTILEAIDIFFNDKKACNPISFEDINKESSGDNIEISICFSWLSDEIILDTIPTKVEDEYIKNEEWLLEIKKVYTGDKMKVATYIVANYPSNDDVLKKLLTYKITDLRRICIQKWLNVEDWRKSADYRKAIIKSYDDLDFSKQDISIDKEWLKEIWSSLEKQLPTYSLFQSDRSNSDQDNEIQNPMKLALNSILSKPEILEKLSTIFNEVMEEMKKVADWTLLQLQKINSTLAEQLVPKIPDFDKLSWDKPFSKTEITSDEVSLNKRWSWVKRIVLLSFFLNEVERRRQEEWLSDIIYAFEEPETSQHPEHQKLLVNAFRELSKTQWVQVILTTHSPYVYKEFTNDKNINLLHIKEENWIKTIADAFQSFNLFPHSPSWWEINYYVYDLSTFEFFDELYSRLEELNTHQHVDDFIISNSSVKKDIKWKKAKNDWTFDKEVDSTYITCIRHQIHHSNNNLNPDYKWRLEEWIKDMIQILKNLNP